MEFLDSLSNANDVLNSFLLELGFLAPVLSSILIVLEGVIAILPLFVFITVNIVTVGPVIGGIISWICTSLGGFLTFYFCRKKISNFFNKKVEKKERIIKFMKRVSNLHFTQLVLIIAIPFAPSFFINLGAGLSKISIKKYLYALLLGKIFIVLFWGYIGANLLECLKNPILLIKVAVLLLIAYIIGRIVNKKFNLDERL